MTTILHPLPKALSFTVAPGILVILVVTCDIWQLCTIGDLERAFLGEHYSYHF